MFCQNYQGLFLNEFISRFNFTVGNKKTLFKKLVKKSILQELIYFCDGEKQIFFNITMLIELMHTNGFKLEEKKFIKLNNVIFEKGTESRLINFRTVQSFKKWINKYIPENIVISVRKKDLNYIVESNIYVSIPFVPKTIKKLDILFKNIDTKFHNGFKIYEVISYKEKKLRRIDKDIEKIKLKWLKYY